jgi:prepilin peptidase CpaA
MSLLALVQTGCLIAFALLLLTAAWQDLRTMQISNRLSVAIVGCFAVWSLAGLAQGTFSLTSLGLAVACAIGAFAVGALAFAFSALGGGDVKLLAAASLFAGPALMLDFLTVTVLVGGVLGLATLAGIPVGPVEPATDGTVRARLRRGLAYGPAIAAGGLWLAALLWT